MLYLLAVDGDVHVENLDPMNRGLKLEGEGIELINITTVENLDPMNRGLKLYVIAVLILVGTG